MNAASQTTKTTFLGLDVVRFTAALMVCFYHLAYWWWRPDLATTGGEGFRDGIQSPVSAAGWIGVPIFFVLSGFVIAYSAQQRSSSNFLKGRISRLYPAAWICASITVVSGILFSAEFELVRYLNSIILNPLGPWVSGVYWTLAVELVFYVLVAIVLWVAGAKYLHSFAVLLGSWSMAYWGLKVIQDFVGFDLGINLQIAGDYEYLTLSRTGCYFALGMLLWQTTKSGWTPFRLLFASGLVLSGLAANVGAARTYLLVDPLGAAPLLLPAAIWLMALAAMYCSVHFAEAINAVLGSQRNVIRSLGLATYPLYLVHSELGRDIMLSLTNLPAYLALWLTILALVALSLGIVELEKLIRQPLTSLLHGQARKNDARR